MLIRSLPLTIVLLLPANWSFAQTTPTGSPEHSDVRRRPQTQAVIDACRERGRPADTRHTLGVLKAALEILEIKSRFPETADADPLTVEVAAMLHDIGGGGHANARPGADISREVLTSLKATHGFSDAFIGKVCRIVETHHVTGAVKGKDDGPEWYVVVLADSPKIYSASPEDREGFSRLIRERIDELRTMVR